MEEWSLTVDAMNRLVALGFPTASFPDIHHLGFSWDTHWNYATDGKQRGARPRGENVRTRERMTGLIKLREGLSQDDVTGFEWDDLVQRVLEATPTESGEGPSSIPTARSGLYVARPLSDDPMAVDRDPRRQALPTVTRACCKFGKAQNLQARKRAYGRVFDPVVVDFRVVAEVDKANLREFEKKVLEELKSKWNPVAGTREWFAAADIDDVASRVGDLLARISSKN